MKQVLARLREVGPRLVQFALNNKPIRKVIVAAVAAGVLYVARLLHVGVGSEEVQRAIDASLPIVAAYLTPDPKVNG